MDAIQPAPKKRPIGLTYGLITALVIIVFTAVMYLGGANLFLGNLGYLVFLMLIVMGVVAAVAEKKANGGWLTLQDALKTCFLVYVIGLAAQTLFVWLLLNVIDTNFKNVVAQVSLQKMEEVLRRFGVSEEKIDQAVADQRGKDQFTLGKMIMGLAFYYIAFFVIALIVAAIVKKKKPEFTDAGF